jgi:hypothetical protein
MKLRHEWATRQFDPRPWKELAVAPRRLYKLAIEDYKTRMEISPTESIRPWFIENVPYDRDNAEVVEYLNSRTAHDLLVIYHNWMTRFIRTQPRTVLKISGLPAEPNHH